MKFGEISKLCKNVSKNLNHRPVIESTFSKFQAVYQIFESSCFIEQLFFRNCFSFFFSLFDQGDLIRVTASSLVITDKFVAATSFAMVLDMMIQPKIFDVIPR